MSQQGINKAAALMNAIQTARHELVQMGSKTGAIDKQDILLGQLFSRANDAIKDDFARIVAGQMPKESR